MPYAYRHSYAQRHADSGVPIDVLAELLDHRSYSVTSGYYRIGEDRRRDAVDKVTALSFDRHGSRIWRDARALLDSERARHAIGEVAVPYGTCTEPSNVQAGGGACPIRFRCAGCDHFRTNVAFLPDLQAYLQDLLRTRERLAAAINGVDEWARADATPAEEEIARIRHLIAQIKGDIAGLGRRRARPDRRSGRGGAPSPRRARCPPRHARPSRPRARTAHRTITGGHRMNAAKSKPDAGRPPGRLRAPPPARHRRTRPCRRGRHARSAPPESPAPPESTGRSSTGTATCWRRSTPSRLNRQPTTAPVPLSPARRCKLTSSQHTNVPSGSAARIHHLEKRLSEALGDQAWRESGLGAPADIDALSQKITHLEQQVLDLKLQLEERDEDLAAARAATRELMTQLNHPGRPR